MARIHGSRHMNSYRWCPRLSQRDFVRLKCNALEVRLRTAKIKDYCNTRWTGRIWDSRDAPLCQNPWLPLVGFETLEFKVLAVRVATVTIKGSRACIAFAHEAHDASSHRQNPGLSRCKIVPLGSVNPKRIMSVHKMLHLTPSSALSH